MQSSLQRIVSIRISSITSYFLIAGSIISYLLIAYYTQRTDHLQLFLSYTFVFAAYLLLLRSGISNRELLASSILFRLLFLLAVPALSDDFYRFIWDGSMLETGINPFAYTPDELLNSGRDLSMKYLDIYPLLNSQANPTIYPPTNQFVFWIAAAIGQGNVLHAILVMRVFALLAEFMSLYFIRALLVRYGMDTRKMFLYALNPLVIIELTGNLHFEFFMVLFTIASLYFLRRRYTVLSGLSMAFAIASKLLPLMFLPFFLKRIRIKKFMIWLAVIFPLSFLLFLPLLDNDFISGMQSSTSLYFKKFEFNASIYYLVREVGYWLYGYNIIQTAGPRLAMAAFVLIMLAFIFEKYNEEKLPVTLMWPLFIYLALASIVHPWYIIPIVAFSVFSHYRFPVVWSFAAFFSYAGYNAYGFEHPYLIYALEYILVFGVAVYELKRKIPFGISGLKQLKQSFTS